MPKAKPQPSMRIKYTRLSEILKAPRNPKRHDEPQMDASVKRFGFADPPTVDERTGKLVEGHGRIEALQRAKAAGASPPARIEVAPDGEWMVPIVRGVSFKTDKEAEAYVIAHNRIGANLWDDAMLAAALAEQDNFDGIGLSDDELAAILDRDEVADRPTSPSLQDRFVVPPFSVLDARQGYWQDRKRRWLSIGIQSEIGRGDTASTSARVGPDEPSTYRTIGGRKATAAPGGASLPLVKAADGYVRRGSEKAAPGGSKRPAAKLGKDGKTLRGDWSADSIAAQARKRLTWVPGDRPVDEMDDTSRRNAAAQATGTSIFDPVLCELAYRWFAPPGAAILDPFAGGSVRGIVAAALGHRYVGIDLRPEQVAANREQWQEIGNRLEGASAPRWLEGDSRAIPEMLGDEIFDLVFSCPPYADLERYSDDPRDLSTLEYAEFIAVYRAIVAAAVARLKPHRFACFVVGDVRDPKGIYRNFVAHTIDAFQAAGAALYNEAILVTSVGSLPIRAGRQFSAGRKLGKTHQNVLVFVKGDPKEAAKAAGKIAVEFPSVSEAGEGLD